MNRCQGQVPAAVIVFLFSAAVFSLFIFYHIPPKFSVFFILICIIFAVSFVNTDIALTVLILSMLFSPGLKTGQVSGREIIIRADDLLLLVVFLGWLAKMAVRKELVLFKTSVLNLPIISYILVCVVSSLISVNQGKVNFKTSFFFTLKYIEYLLLFLMVFNNLRSRRQARRFVYFLLFTSFLVCAYSYTKLGAGSRLSAPFQSGETSEPNTLAAYLLLMMALSLGLGLHTESNKQRPVFLFIFAFSLIPFIFTLSRGGWIAFFPMLLVIIKYSKRFKMQLILLFLVVIISLPFIVPRRVHQRLEETFYSEAEINVFGKTVHLSESAAARINTWIIAFENFNKSPLLGSGITGGGTVIDSQYTRVIIETGALGIITSAWLIILLFNLGRQAFKKCADDGFAQGVSLGFLAGFIGLLVHAFSAATFILIRVMEPFWFLAAIVAKLPELQEMPDGHEE